MQTQAANEDIKHSSGSELPDTSTQHRILRKAIDLGSAFGGRWVIPASFLALSGVGFYVYRRKRRGAF